MKIIKLEIDDPHKLMALLTAISIRVDQIKHQVAGIEFTLSIPYVPSVSNEAAHEMRENLGLYAEESEALIEILESIQKQMGG